LRFLSKTITPFYFCNLLNSAYHSQLGLKNLHCPGDHLLIRHGFPASGEFVGLQIPFSADIQQFSSFAKNEHLPVPERTVAVDTALAVAIFRIMNYSRTVKTDAQEFSPLITLEISRNSAGLTPPILLR